MQTLIKSAAVFCVGSFKRVLFSKILFCFTCLKRNNPTAKIPTNVVRMFVIPKETLISGEIKPYKNNTKNNKNASAKFNPSIIYHVTNYSIMPAQKSALFPFCQSGRYGRCGARRCRRFAARRSLSHESHPEYPALSRPHRWR